MRSSSVLNRPLSGFLTILLVSALLIVATVQTARAQNERTVLLNQVSVNAAACSGGFTPIFSLQENGVNYGNHGTVFTVEGIVTGDYQSAGNTGLRGFYLQDQFGDTNAATSDGIFVFDSTNTVVVNVGDRVRVSGKVNDSFGMTRITATNIESCGTTGTISPTLVSLPFANTDSAENYEGMLVTFTQTLTVSDVSNLGMLGQVVLSSGGRLYSPTAITNPGTNANAQDAANHLNRITLDDGIIKHNPSPTPYLFDDGSGLTLRAGDTVANLNGILGQRSDAYILQPVDNPTFVRSNLRTAVPALTGDLTIASFNLMNYFNGPSFPTSQGATTRTEFTRQRNKTIAAISQMNADVIGLTEIENDAASGSAIQNLVAGLNAVMGAGTYAFIDTGVIGTEETRVAILYKPASVTPLGSFMIDTNGVYSQLPLAQTFEDHTTGGIFTVIVNSFKSRNCINAADLNLDQGDGQSCYNEQRTRQSTALLNFINDDVFPASGDSDVLILGDLNAYTFENPITTLETGGYTNLIRSLLGTTAYSYVSGGESGYLNHALASSSLVAQVADVDHWHINADEPRVLDYNVEGKSDAQDALNVGTPYRASDHDPVLIGLSLTSDVAATVRMETVTGSGIEASAGQVSVDVVLNLGNSNGFSISEVVASVMLSGTAVENSDYTLGRNSVTFPAGSVDGATKTLTLTIEDDSLVETDETIVVTLNGASNASVGAADTFTYTITDDETATVSFSSNSSSAAEGAGSVNAAVVLNLTWTGTAAGNLQDAINISITDAGTGSATTPADYTLGSGSVTFAAGAGDDATQNVMINVVDDSVDENDETVPLRLTVSSGEATTAAPRNHTLTITDNDTTTVQTAAVEFSSASASTTDDVGTTYNVEVVLTTSDGQPLIDTLTVDVSDLGTGSATPTADYNFSTTTLTFAASAPSGSTQTATIAVVADTEDEANETVNLGLGNVTGTHASLGTQTSYTLTITGNSSGTPGVTISNTTLRARPGAVRTYTVVLNTQPTGNVVIAITSPARCIVRPRNLTFTAANWNTPQTVRVTVRPTAVPGTRCIMRHSAMGGGYDGVSISRVVLTIRR